MKLTLTTILGLLAMAIGFTGCAHIDHFGGNMDMAVSRLTEKTPHEYEGRLDSAQQVGPMVALQFIGGTYYDVVEAPPGLSHGDIVRIYKVENGYKAHLWKRNSDQSLITQPVKRAGS
jgi:hypothetical protein